MKNLKLNEKLACKLLSHMTGDQDMYFKNNWWNHVILKIAKRFLHGRDPIVFLEWLVEGEDCWAFDKLKGIKK